MPTLIAHLLLLAVTWGSLSFAKDPTPEDRARAIEALRQYAFEMRQNPLYKLVEAEYHAQLSRLQNDQSANISKFNALGDQLRNQYRQREKSLERLVAEAFPELVGTVFKGSTSSRVFWKDIQFFGLFNPVSEMDSDLRHPDKTTYVGYQKLIETKFAPLEELLFSCAGPLGKLLPGNN